MKQVWITKPGLPEVFSLREAPDPIPGPNEVRIRVKAIGVNFADIMARMGLYPDAPKLPAVIGYEVSGTVDAVGNEINPIGAATMSLVFAVSVATAIPCVFPRFRFIHWLPG